MTAETSQSVSRSAGLAAVSAAADVARRLRRRLGLASGSRTTSVFAARSPSRWLRRVTRIETIAGTYKSGSPSIRRTRLRTELARRPTGSPPSITTRSPFQRLPGVRPDASTSNATW